MTIFLQLFFLYFFSGANFSGEVRLHSMNSSAEDEVLSRSVYLSDIAEIRNLSEVDTRWVAGIKIADSLKEYQALSFQQVLKKIRPDVKNFESRCECKLQFTVPNKGDAATKSAGNFSESQQFSLALLKDHLLVKLQKSCLQCAYEMSDLQLLRGQIPKTYKKWIVQTSEHEIKGPSMVRVFFDEDAFNPLVVQTLVKMRKPVLVLKSNALLGQVLTPDLFEVIEKDITYETSQFLSLEDISGKEVRRSLMKGTSLKVDDVIEKNLVRYGQEVSVVMQKNTLSIQMTGLAQKNGKQGDRIPIKIPRTNKQVMAEVIGDSQVRL